MKTAYTEITSTTVTRHSLEFKFVPSEREENQAITVTVSPHQNYIHLNFSGLSAYGTTLVKPVQYAANGLEIHFGEQAHSAPAQIAPEQDRAEYVPCPVCGNPDTRKTTHGPEKDVIFHCTNHACASNGGDNIDGLRAQKRFQAIKKAT